MTIRIAVTVALLAVLAALPGGAAGAGSTTIVLSEIYGGGGNAGAPYDHDFVELLNVSSSPVNLNGWTVQYATASGSSWQVTPLPNVSLGPRQHLLVQEASGGTNGAVLPAPDAIGTIALAASSGKVALVASPAALTGACPTGVVDLVGYGSATCFEGAAAAAAPSNANSVQRKQGGRQDSNDNGADFDAAAPQPQNTASPSAVRLLSFVAARTGAILTLHWRTAMEDGIVGYHVYRGHDGRLLRLDAKLIPVLLPGSGRLRFHAWQGPLARPAGAERYVLQAVGLDGRRIWLGSAWT